MNYSIVMATAAVMLAGCAADVGSEADEGEDTAVATGALEIGYTRDWLIRIDRHIYAYGVDPRSTPIVRLTARPWEPLGDWWKPFGDADECRYLERPMNRLAPGNTSAQICAELGLNYQVEAGIQGCYSRTGHEPEVVWEDHFFEGVTQVNFQVIEYQNGRKFRESIWAPPGLNNGCKR